MAGSVAPLMTAWISRKRRFQSSGGGLGLSVGAPVPMTAHSGRGGATSWTARNIKVPAKGKHRLSVEQYEVLPADRRGTGLYRLIGPPRAARLLFQDVIEL